MKIVTIILIFLAVNTPSFATEMKILTENYPPFNYEKDGEIKGAITSIVKHLMKDIGWNQDIQLLSWNKAYNLIENNSGYILYSMALNEKRKNKFKWVGPLLFIDGYYYQKQNSNKKWTTKEDIKQNALVGVRENSNTHKSLLIERYQHIVPLESPEAYYRGLYYGRIDIIISSPWNIPFRVKSFDLPSDAFERTQVPAGQGELYIAFSKNTPDEVVQLWQRKLDALKATPQYQKIFDDAIREVSNDFNVDFDLPAYHFVED